MSTLSARSFARSLALVGALILACPTTAAFAQNSSLPLIGIWSSQSQDQQTGARLFETDVYNPDGTTIGTVRLANGLMMRVFGHYQARQIGPNQLQVELRAESVLPRQICSGPANCRPFPVPPMQPPLTLTFIDQNTIQSVNGTSRRDQTGGLSYAPVLESVVLPDSNPSPQYPAPNPGLPDLCTLGAQQCFSGYLRTCERWPNGQANWMTGATTC